MTIHASKGQQADYVIVLGLQEGEDAFPAPARESIMEQALLPQPEDFPDAEERRLLYVALTRARHRVWLLFNKAQPRRLSRSCRRWMRPWPGSRNRGSIISGARQDSVDNPGSEYRAAD
ncbi:DNA helicase IV [Klebsiella pneumoniae]|uniref:DNA helicase IV n=1 Tax=Klebsiella pneumoniae TaxID=573 RepID=A0A378BDR7_KLEPN|nr:DNA helicase IV [Klebsiella pneumoniae]